MSDSRSQQEPSMEEILASIRRIISEDADGPKSAAPASAPYAATHADDDILDLTDRFDEEAPAVPRGSSSVNLFDDDFAVATPPARPSFEHHDDEDDGLLSGGSLSAAANAFAALDDHDEPEPMPMARPAASGALDAGITVEQLAREALRPLLKDWLDQNLPPIVEAIVRSEVERANRRR
jgi:cell pole-organizing protein PopZ